MVANFCETKVFACYTTLYKKSRTYFQNDFKPIVIMVFISVNNSVNCFRLKQGS